MFMYMSFQPIFALVAGILILIFPRLLNYIIALYLIIIGVAGLIQ
jgi:threonine/homoserine efflux transporter RhtA